MSDADRIPDETMRYLRKIAVRAIEEKSYSQETISDVLGISRSSVYECMRRYRAGGWEALDMCSSPGAPPLITTPIEDWPRYHAAEVCARAWRVAMAEVKS